MNPNAALKKSPQKAVIAPQDIERIQALRETQKALKDRLELMDRSIKDAEHALIAQIDAGADISRCGYQIAVQTIEKRYPAWKEEFISRLGKDAADTVLESTEPTVYRKLAIK